MGGGGGGGEVTAAMLTSAGSASPRKGDAGMGEGHGETIKGRTETVWGVWDPSPRTQMAA